MQLPIEYIQTIEQLLGPEKEAFLSSFEQERYYGLRLNGLKLSKKDHQQLPYLKEQVSWCAQGYYYDQQEQPAKDPYYFAGAYYIQEPSAMTPVEALGIQEGDKVIDLCGAPGGKSTQIASHLGHSGLLVANDLSNSRAKTMDKNLVRFGAREMIVLSEEPSKLAKQWPEQFDRVLVDAPCSGEGMFRKEHKLIESWQDKGPETFVPIQAEILKAAYDLLKPGGSLVYSTCTYNQQENEGQIQAFLDTYDDMQMTQLPYAELIEQGFSSFECGPICGRVWPHKHKGEGHFIAKLTKVKRETKPIDLQGEQAKIPSGDKEAVLSFLEGIGYHEREAISDRLTLVGDRVFVLPERGLPIKGLRTLSNGWQIGRVKKGRFEPGQALANGLLKEDLTQVVDLEKNDPRAWRYLKGETIEAQMEKGWCLVAYDGLGIGFAKAQNNRLKNKIEPSWRWM